MKLHWISLVVAMGLLALAASARADTLMTGVLSPDTVKEMCSSVGANYNDYGSRGYGCHNGRLTIACQASLDCVSKIRDLNSYLGNSLTAYMRAHGLRQVDPLSRSYND